MRKQTSQTGRQTPLWKLLFQLFCALAPWCSGAAGDIIVPGSANPWLAGMPAGSASSSMDFAPDQSPVQVLSLAIVPGSVLMFSASGSVKKGPEYPYSGPDGNADDIGAKVVGSENGMSDLIAPKTALLGVFLGPDPPDQSAAPALLAFYNSRSRDYAALSPQLKQVFFIGDGLTSGGLPQRVTVPNGATRLFLGTMDGIGWFNNEGSFSVDVRFDAPSITINDVAVREGSSGAVTADFTVQLSSPSSQVVTVDYATADGTAIAGTDYVMQAGTVSFAAGETSRTISVAVQGDTQFELDEMFFVNFRGSANGIIVRNQGQATILNDDTENSLPQVLLVEPANHAVLPSGTDIRLTALASDSDGQVAQVEFYAGSQLLGVDTNSPFTLVWTNVPTGDHVLAALAIDDRGARATNTIVVAVSPISGDVAIVQNSGGPEIAKLQEYLFEMGLSSHVFTQTGLSYEALRQFQLIIWNDLGDRSQELTDNTVGVLHRATTNGMPLYFIGENLASAAANLSELRRTVWTDLTHLNPATGQTNNLTISLSDGDFVHPILRSRFGIIEDFAYLGRMDLVTVSAPHAEVLARSGGAEVLVAYPDQDEPDVERVRSVTQGFLVFNNGDEFSRAERKELFQNAVCWLIRCPSCNAINTRIESAGSADTARVGEPLSYELRVLHSGECEATGVIVTNKLPANVRFLRADAEQGTWREENGLVVFNLGRLAKSSITKMTITVMPLGPGELRILATVRINGPEPVIDDNVTEFLTRVEGSPLVSLSIVELEADRPRLRLNGETGRSYRIQTSTDLSNWIELTNAISAGWTAPLFDLGGTSGQVKFYRAVFP